MEAAISNCPPKTVWRVHSSKGSKYPNTGHVGFLYKENRTSDRGVDMWALGILEPGHLTASSNAVLLSPFSGSMLVFQNAFESCGNAAILGF